MLQGYAVNVPLTDGLDDEMFVHDVFMPVIDGVMEHYRPSVIVLQCGADSLAGDKIGKFNLSTLGHAEAGRYLRHIYPNVPVMMLGGGGYTISNVARTWSYETMAMLGYQDEQIPYYCPIDPFYWEHVKQERVYGIGAVPHRVPRVASPNRNKREKIQKIVSNIRMNLQEYVRPVSVPFEDAPEDALKDVPAVDGESCPDPGPGISSSKRHS
eukprot:jgi/Ulvmu1/3185/UM015_0226.1